MGNLFDSSDRTGEFDSADIQAASTISGISYLFILFFLPLVVNPGSAFGKFHANQSLILLIAGIVCSILGKIFNIIGQIPVIGEIIALIGGIAIGLISILLFVFMIMGMINAFSGKAKELPIIGKIAIIK